MDYPSVPHVPYLREFYAFQFTHHFYSLFYHVRTRKIQSKFYEMLLHHLFAIYLLIFSYLTNFVLFGILVLMAHDGSDIGLILSRGYNEYKYKNKILLYTIFGISLANWIFQRLYFLPFFIINEAIVMTNLNSGEELESSFVFISGII